MKRLSPASLLSAAALCAVASSLLAQAPAPATQPAPTLALAPATPSDVPVTHVVLFSSGVGYFEHNGSVTGPVTADLRFETAQINDVLKSLVVFDRGGGHVSTITYPANDPVGRTLRTFAVNLAGDPPMVDILSQIRGTPVSLTIADDVVKGLVLGLEQKERVIGKADTERVLNAWYVNLITDAGIRSVALDDIRKLDILDDKIKTEMNQALAALVQARDQSKKTVTIHFDGAAKRDVGMGYLVETPIWKTTYRLLLPDAKSANTAELQAWAIVENQTDNDWKDVSLSLVGGRPISYIELLYQPFYVARPVISPSVIGSLVPQTYDNGFGLSQPNFGVNVQAPSRNLSNFNPYGNNNGGGFGGGGYFNANNGGGFGNNNNNNNGGGLSNAGGNNSSNNGPPAAPTPPVEVPPAPTVDFAQGVASIAEATKIGEMFHFTVDKVSLARQQSSMIPIIAEGVKFDRVSIYSPGISAKYALRGARLYNGTGKYLLGGPVTVMDTVKEGHSYAGDAKIEDIPPGQSRLLTYAIDQETTIQVAPDKGDDNLLTGSIDKGVLWLKYRSQITREYTLQNKGDADKTIVIESPLAPGYDLIDPAKPQDKTDKYYRFQIDKLAPGQPPATFKVVLERTRLEKMELVRVQNDPLLFYVAQDKIPPKVREVLQTVAAKRAAIAVIEGKLARNASDRANFQQDVSTIRENIKVLPVGKSQDDQIGRLNQRMTDLDASAKELQELQAALDAARAELSKYLESTTIE